MKKLLALFVLVVCCAMLSRSVLNLNRNLSNLLNVSFSTAGAHVASNVLPFHQEGVALSD